MGVRNVLGALAGAPTHVGTLFVITLILHLYDAFTGFYRGGPALVAWFGIYCFGISLYATLGVYRQPGATQGQHCLVRRKRAEIPGIQPQRKTRSGRYRRRAHTGHPVSSLREPLLPAFHKK